MLDAPLASSAASPLERVVNFYETLTPESLRELPTVYTEDARFRDPFNDVQGVEAIRRIFAHMYRQLDDPRFIVRERLGDAQQAFLTWDFVFRFRGEARERRIRGCTHLCFAADARVREHRDYWDAAEELYAQLPLIGALMRWLQRRLAARD
ncbi:nuclear transport factor 2 family protein [Tepidimonas taiwanensis]|nr:nuclear transport factor 2 family protein [Tepidimonas taiwanensis]